MIFFRNEKTQIWSTNFEMKKHIQCNKEHLAKNAISNKIITKKFGQLKFFLIYFSNQTSVFCYLDWSQLKWEFYFYKGFLLYCIEIVPFIFTICILFFSYIDANAISNWSKILYFHPRNVHLFYRAFNFALTLFLFHFFEFPIIYSINMFF